MGKVLAVCISEKRGTQKKNVEKVRLIENYGLEGDAHAGNWHRQVSLLSYDRIREFNERGAGVDHGAFGENLAREMYQAADRRLTVSYVVCPKDQEEASLQLWGPGKA